MNALDFFVLITTMLFIVIYGVWKTRGQKNIQEYLLGNNSQNWATIGLSVMATQASAITFISTPGQAYQSGMAFVQNYFGVPIALLIVSGVFIPIFYKYKVFTAYEFLERRFDVKTRVLGALLFLVQRGLSAGITIYAPAIILSTVLGWDLQLTVILTGVMVIIYTMSGGTKAVSVTQKQQMAVMMGGMFVAFGVLAYYISQHVPLTEAYNIAGILEKTDAIDLDFNFEKRYTIWSGLAAGLFLQLSYFGTDQSQVGRYLGGKSTEESRKGLMFNAILKVPMQFFILFVGVTIYLFYLFHTPPVHFKEQSLDLIRSSVHADELGRLESAYTEVLQERKDAAVAYSRTVGEEKQTWALALADADSRSESIREDVKQLITAVDVDAETTDSDFVFLEFILTYLPHGLIGLLIAVVLSAAMSSTSSALNALASTSTVDFYKRLVNPNGSDASFLIFSRVMTLVWGLVAISFALLIDNSENLIEAVNIVGSLFYGAILGIFLVAFFLKRVKGTAVFMAAVVAQVFVIICHFLTVAGVFELGYLWYNAIGMVITIVLSLLFSIKSSGN